MNIRRYKDEHEQEGAVEGWQTIYCSLVLILVVFFIMLVSYSVADKGKLAELKDNFKEYRDEDGEDKKGGGRFSQNDAALVNEAMRSLKKAGAAALLEGGVILERTPGGFKCKLKSDVLFPSGSARINEKMFPYLDEIVRLAADKTFFLRVEGHTDDLPVRGLEYESNWELSATRAVNVLRYFLEKGNIPAERLAAMGFSQYHPLAANDTPEGRMKNRRIEVFFEFGEKRL